MATPTSSPSKGDSEIGEAINHFIQGKRHLLVQDYVSAVGSLQEACQLYAQKYGEWANECGEPYLYYGKALLELARMETGVLGNALEGVPNEEESESEEDSQVENPENLSEEEREQIKRDVDAAIDENSRDLDEKFKKLQESNAHESAEDKKLEGKSLDESAPEGRDKQKLVNGPVEHEKDGERVDFATSFNAMGEISMKVNEMVEAVKSEVEKNGEVETKEKVVGVVETEDSEMEDVEKTKADTEEKTASIKISETDGGDKVEDIVKAECGSEATSDDAETLKAQSNSVGKEEQKMEMKIISATEESDIPATESVKEEVKSVATVTNGSESKEPKTAEDELMEVGEDEETNADEEMDSKVEPGPADSDKEEEISNLQLAWEVLELAKVIFKRQSETDKKMELKTAETLLKLGEIGIESENYKQAIDDLSECLSLQKQHLTSDDRAVAETFYQLGLAYSFHGQYEESIENFHRSMQVIEERIANLQQSIADGLGGNMTGELEDPVAKAKREMKDLEDVLPDIKAKMEDTEDLMRTSAAALKEAALQRLQEDTSTDGFVASESGDNDKASRKPATNISHLLKRKRKSEGSVGPSTDAEVKKKRASSGNGISNGETPTVTMEGDVKAAA